MLAGASLAADDELDARGIMGAAEARNGLATWKDRTSTVVLETFEGSAGWRRRATVVEQIDPHGAHGTRIDFADSGDETSSRTADCSSTSSAPTTSRAVPS